MARIVEPTPQAIREAVDRLRAGDCVAFATETVYGLGGDTFNTTALNLIYELKGRPANNPLIAHVLDAEQAMRVVRKWDDRCELLSKMFWPGPLTMVLPKAERVPLEATAGLNTIAVRAPNHDVARALLREFDGPISAPSANRSGHVSPTTARHVADEFAGVADLTIVDGGRCRVGIESTVLDLTAQPARVLRPGMVTPDQLRSLIGQVESAFVASQAASPGTSLRHYAPRTAAELVSSEELPSRLKTLKDAAAVVCFDAQRVPLPHRAIEMPLDAAAYAARLYDAIREADALHCNRILIEQPPEVGALWEAVHDRLRRATSK